MSYSYCNTQISSLIYIIGSCPEIASCTSWYWFKLPTQVICNTVIRFAEFMYPYENLTSGQRGCSL